MNKKIILPLLISSLFVAGCSPKVDDYGPDDEKVELIEPTNVIDKYKAPDISHRSKPEETTKYVRIHYRRNDDTNNNREVYQLWNMRAWDMTNNQGCTEGYDFTNYDAYGVYVDIDLELVSNNQYMDKLGFIVRTDNWDKDPDGDRSIDIKSTSPGGIQEIYLKSKVSTVYENQDDALKSSISYAVMMDSSKIGVFFNPLKSTFKTYPKRFGIKINGNDYEDFTMGEYLSDSKFVELDLKDELDITDTIVVTYKFDSTWINETPLVIANYFNSDEFVNKYSYSGDDLGVSFDDEDNPSKTTFKLWAPTSKEVTLNVYSSGDYKTDLSKLHEIKMNKKDKGVFECSINEDLDGKYYTFTVNNSKGINEVVDPYAKSAGLNGKRGMIVNFSKLNKELNWKEDNRPEYGNNATEASIYEAHIRDLTINPNSGVSSSNRGKFLGLTEKNTTYSENGVTVKTGLDHIKELGITHLQIQPVYDFSSVDESLDNKDMSETNYNWGYDPLNYNCLEGSYSSNPNDGYSRIKEFKEMIKSLHQEGINVNMDVVYNHTSSSENSNFNLIVPYYYYRTYGSGSFYNGSGCGNEMASDRYMVNKFIRESCEFYVDEYHISGFRFDLMGLIDNQTMIDVYKDCKNLYPNVLVYGEPWTGGTTKLKEDYSSDNLSNQKTIQKSLAQSYFSGDNVLVGAFNDVIRNAIKGDNNPSRGYVQGLYAQGSDILKGIKGTFSSASEEEKNINPNQVLNYVSCHDNYTLNDQLALTMKSQDYTNAYTQADSIVFLSQGVPFIQEGEDFMRSKAKEDGTYEHNSYNVGDFINNMDYSLKIKNINVFNKTKELIEFRKNNQDSFCLASRSDIDNKLKDLTYSSGLISYKINDFVILHAAKAQEYSLDGSYEVVYSNVKDTYSKFDSTYNLLTNESVVLKKVN